MNDPENTRIREDASPIHERDVENEEYEHVVQHQTHTPVSTTSTPLFTWTQMRQSLLAPSPIQHQNISDPTRGTTQSTFSNNMGETQTSTSLANDTHLGSMYQNLVDACDVTQDLMREGMNESQASCMAAMLSGALKKLEERELVLLDSMATDPLPETRSLKIRSRKLVAQCHGFVKPQRRVDDNFNSPSNSESHCFNFSDNYIDRQTLPKIQLAKFNGDFSKWGNFWGIFSALVDRRPDISNIIKFNYLLQSLTDEALEVVKGLNISEYNYVVAVQLLTERYGNTHKSQQLLIRRFNNLPVPKNTLSDLKHFTLLARQLLAQIQGQEVIKDANEFIKSLIIQKLPKSVFESIVNKFGKFDFNLEQLFEGLTFVIDLLEFNEIKQGDFTPVKTVMNKSKTNVKKGKCPLCSENHRAYECNKFKSRDSIVDRVKRLRLCFNCLSSHHRAKECGSKHSCRHCQSRHHSLLCNMKDKSNESPSSNEQQQPEKKEKKNRPQ